jgi:Protein of unknown function (DUF2946)
MTRRTPARAKQPLLYALCVAFAIKALIPLGYMPAAFGEGWPIKLCHAWPMPGHAQHHEHAHHDGGKQSDDEWEHCPLGALAAAPVLQSEHRLDLPPPPRSFGATTAAAVTIVATAIGFRARAPPSLTSSY